MLREKLMNELATILLPTYNGQKYIGQMLDSIYRQDYRPIEVIITDDASTDRTISVIARWLKNKNFEDFSFKIIKNKHNMGLSGNVSRGAKYVHGKFLFLADQDDIWKEDKVSSQIAYLKQNKDCIMCICDRSIINEQNKVVCASFFRYKKAKLQKRDYKAVLNSQPRYSANCMCLRTEHLDSIFPVPTRMTQHDFFIAIMAAHYGKIGYLKKSLTLYRIHGNNLSLQCALETNKNLLKAGYMIAKGYKRKNERESRDPQIIEEELRKRFHESVRGWSKKIYSGEIKHVYWETIRYLFYNIETRWKKFC